MVKIKRTSEISLNESGYDSLVLSDEHENWMIQANEEFVELFDGTLSLFDSTKTFE